MNPGLVILVVSCLAPALFAEDVPALPPDPLLVFTFEESTLTRGKRDARIEESTGRKIIGKSRLRSIAGIAGAGMDVKGSADTVEVEGDLDAIDLARHLTVSAWVRIREFHGANYIVSKEDWKGGAMRGWVLRVQHSGSPEFVIGDKGWHPVKSTPIDTGKWYHLVATCVPSELELWVDGRKANTEKWDGEMDPSPLDLTIGKGNYDKGRGFDGAIDEVGIWGRKLSSDEIQALYERGKAGKPLVAEDPDSSARDAGVELTSLAGGNRHFQLSRAPQGKLVLATLLDEKKGGVRVVDDARNSKAKIEIRVGKGLELGSPFVVELPLPADGGAKAFDAVCTADGALHLIATTWSNERWGNGYVYCRLDPAARSRGKWVDLGKLTGLELSNVRVFPSDRGAVAIYGLGDRLVGETERGGREVEPFWVSAVATTRRLRVTGKHRDKIFFSNGRHTGKFVAKSVADPWVLHWKLTGGLSWNQFKTQAAAECVESSRAKAFQMTRVGKLSKPVYSLGDKPFDVILGRDRQVVIAWQEPQSRTRVIKGRGNALSQLLVARGKLGARIEDIFTAKLARTEWSSSWYELVTTPKREVILLAMVSENDYRRSRRLEAWRVGQGEPEPLGLIARVPRSDHVSAVFTDEKTLCFVVGDGNERLMGTWRLDGSQTR